LSDAGYLGDVESLAGMTIAGGPVLRAVAGELMPLRTASPPASHLDALLAFLTAHESTPPRQMTRFAKGHFRARAAILGLLTSLRDAYARFDSSPVDFDTVAALVRRWIGSHTFAPRTGDAGVHLVDAESAKFGDFDAVQLAGLVDGEWPERPRRNIFYSGGILRDLGWPAEADRLDGARAAFRDLLRLPASRLIVSAFTLEDDALTAASTFLDELEGAALEEVEYSPSPIRIFDYERPAKERLPFDENRYRGYTSGHAPLAYSLSALERYQDCPFKFFANDVLRLEELPEDEPALSPRARGRFIHEVFQRFFEAWDGRGGETDHVRAPRRGAIALRGGGASARLPVARGRCFAGVDAALWLGDLGWDRRRRPGPGSVAADARAGTLARVSPRGRLCAWQRRRPARAAQRGGRPHRPAGGQPPSGHRLQVGVSAEHAACAAGPHLCALRERASGGARRNELDGGRSRVRRRLQARERWCP
jgi:hypothetical protein